MSEHDLTQVEEDVNVSVINSTLQEIPDINYNKKELATPFLVNDILEEGSAPYPGPGPVRMNCSPPPSPGSQSALSPSLLYSSYPGRPSVTATSMAASFSPTTMTSSGAVPSKWEGREHLFSSSLLNSHQVM